MTNGTEECPIPWDDDCLSSVATYSELGENKHREGRTLASETTSQYLADRLPSVFSWFQRSLPSCEESDRVNNGLGACHGLAFVLLIEAIFSIAGIVLFGWIALFCLR